MALKQLAQWYFTYFPVDKGKWGTWRKFMRTRAYRSFKKGEYRTTYDTRMILDPDENIDRFIFYWGAWEPDEAWLISRLLREGDVFCDVGANEGFFTLLAARRIGDSGKVIAFEPVPATADRLKYNITINDFNNIEVIQAGAVEEPASITLSRRSSEDSSGVFSMRRQDGDTFTVPGVRMDDVLGSMSRKVRLVKIDIEGAELLALKGFSAHLAKADAPMVLCEVTDDFLRAMGSSARDLYNFMSDFGYQPYYLRGHCTRPLDVDWAVKQFQLNVLFTKNGIPL